MHLNTFLVGIQRRMVSIGLIPDVNAVLFYVWYAGSHLFAWVITLLPHPKIQKKIAAVSYRPHGEFPASSLICFQPSSVFADTPLALWSCPCSLLQAILQQQEDAPTVVIYYSYSGKGRSCFLVELTLVYFLLIHSTCQRYREWQTEVHPKWQVSLLQESPPLLNSVDWLRYLLCFPCSSPGTAAYNIQRIETKAV